MNPPLTGAEVAAISAWVIVLRRAHPLDRRYVAIMATGDVGAMPVVTCREHLGDARITFTEAYQHMAKASTPCDLVSDLAGVEVSL